MNQEILHRKKARIRSKISGDAVRPRLSVYRSSKFIYAQLIDDTTGKTLAFSSDRKSADVSEQKNTEKLTKTERAKNVGSAIAEQAMKLKIKQVRFDRGGFLYHGRIKAVAEAARTAGLEF